MDKIKMLKDLGYNNAIIEDVKKKRRFCAVYEENELEELSKDFDCSIEDIKADRIEGIDVYRHEDGTNSYLLIEC